VSETQLYTDILTDKNCHQCGSRYRVPPSQSSSRYCSRSCYTKARPRNKRSAVSFCRLYEAKHCGHLVRRGVLRCRPCRMQLNWMVIECQSCGGPINCRTWEQHKHKTCSDKCHNAWVASRQAGAQSHLWRGGLSDINHVLRESATAKAWRNSVFERDNFTCVHCGQRGGKLCADHIKPWCRFPELRFEISNGRTLCWPCHQKTPTFGHRARTAAV
jgi:hypothetical protein